MPALDRDGQSCLPTYATEPAVEPFWVLVDQNGRFETDCPCVRSVARGEKLIDQAYIWSS